MSELLRTILIMSLSGSVVAVLLFALKPLVRDRLPKSAQYYLWLVVLAALLVPVSKMVLFNNRALPVPAAPIISDTVSRYVITVEEELDMLQRASIPSGAESPALTPEAKEAQSPLSAAVTMFVIAYPFGVLIVLLYVIINNKVFTGLHRRRNHTANAEETAMLAELCGRKRTPRLYRNPLAATPMLFGLFRPMILLPDREYTNDQLRAVLLHELTHLRRNDILVKWLSVLACAVHWFNPIAWFMRREIDRACELACDEAVVRNLDADGKQNYGETLLTVAADSKTPRAVLSTTMCEEKKALKERLGAILKNKKHTRVAIFVSVLLIFAVGGVAVALGAGRGEPLIEMEIVEVPMNAHGTTIDIKWGDRIYSNSSDLIQGDAYSLHGKQIGYGKESGGTRWKIYECKGYSTDDYIVVYPDYMMSSYMIYKSGTGTEPQYTNINFFPECGITMEFPFEYGGEIEVVYIVPAPYESRFPAFVLSAPKLGIGEIAHIDVYKNKQDYYAYDEMDVSYTHIGANDTYDFYMVLATDVPLPDTSDPKFKEASVVFEVIRDAISQGLCKFTLQNVEPQSTAPPPNTYLPQIMHDGITYYYDSRRQFDIELSPSFDAPKITSTVSLAQIPKENGQANFEGSDFGGFGALYTTYHHGLLVYWNDRWAYFVPLEQLTQSIADIIERNLDIITEPSPVSNPYFYIDAHRTEYGEIVFLGKDALQYMFSLFDMGNQHGLRGFIMASACREIMGLDPEFSNAEIDTGQKWYDAYKSGLRDD